MTTLRRRVLRIDDPLGPGRSTQPRDPTDETAIAGGADQARDGRPENRSTDHSTPTGSVPQHGRRQAAPTAAQPTAARQQPTGADEPVTYTSSDPWREWTGPTGVGSFRLPHELLAELGDTARELGLPIGMIVTAAIAQLLDQPPEEIVALVDRADDTRIRGRRIARRRLAERASG